MSCQPIQYRDLYHDKGINYVLISWFGIHTYIKSTIKMLLYLNIIQIRAH